MDKLIRLTLVTIACIAAQACADHPTTAAPVTAAIPSATANTVPPASPVLTSAKAEPVVLNDKTLTQAEVNNLISQGYKPKQQGDSILYCRPETTLGSRFPKRVCLTGVQIKTMIQDSKDETAIMTRNMGNSSQACGGAKCN